MTLVRGLLRIQQQLIESQAMATITSWTSIGKVRRRRTPPMTTGKPLSHLWDDLRIMPIWSDAVATYLCDPGRVSVLSRHAAFQPIREHLLSWACAFPNAWQAKSNSPDSEGGIDDNDLSGNAHHRRR